MGASQYRTGCTRETEKRSIRRSTHAALSWGFVPRWSPSRGRTFFRARPRKGPRLDLKPLPVFDQPRSLRGVTNRSPVAPVALGRPFPFRRKVRPLEVFLGIDSSTAPPSVGTLTLPP